MRNPLSLLVALGAPAALSLTACAERAASCPECQSTVVIAAVGEPVALVPPLVHQTVGRDMSDLVFERLADLEAGASPVDTAAYRPALAARWERVDSLTWRFHLRPGARWHDGASLTAEDVRFSFAAFTDSVLDSSARGYLAGLAVDVEDSLTFRIRFAAPSAEQLYDATYHVRVMPKHVWASLAPERWGVDTSLALLVGSGPYRVREWRRGQYATLEAVPGRLPLPAIRRVVWRFVSDPDAAINLVLSGEADLLETVGGPSQVGRFAGHPSVELRSYPSAVYGFLAFRLADRTGRPHPLLADRQVRRALASAVDRRVIAASLFGPSARAPAGPMSQLLWIWSDSIQTVPHDTSAASLAFESAGWRRAPGEAVRTRRDTVLGFDILVPSTSSSRRQAAVILQEMWRRAGVAVTVTSVDFPVFQERLRAGKFDAYIGSYLDEPSARGLADQWSRAGWDVLNYGRYGSPAFDALLQRAAQTRDPEVARRVYREAMDTLNADVPALFLFAPTNAAAVARRLRGVSLDPYSWLHTLPDWRLEPPGPAGLAQRDHQPR